ncbi:unannotated protein [freshwater metagenome]|uniref:Unannotated protein n=1 Tax=freshwater metagenome TaxID=449393 RepID=A0A6J6ET90_9ZZZZ
MIFFYRLCIFYREVCESVRGYRPNLDAEFESLSEELGDLGVEALEALVADIVWGRELVRGDSGFEDLGLCRWLVAGHALDEDTRWAEGESVSGADIEVVREVLAGRDDDQLLAGKVLRELLDDLLRSAESECHIGAELSASLKTLDVVALLVISVATDGEGITVDEEEILSVKVLHDLGLSGSSRHQNAIKMRKSPKC